MKKKKFDRRILFDYIQQKYDMTVLPKHFYMKLSNIFSGKLEGMLRPVPPEHLYDMWVRKSNYLDKVNARNASLGKNIEGYSRINYDLAILLGKYEDYLKWLERQKILSSENEKVLETVNSESVTYMKNITINNNSTNKNEDNITDLLDEMI